MKKLLLFFTFLSAIALWTHADVVAFVADGFTYSGTGTNVTIKNNSSNNIAGESFSNNDVTITFESANSTKVTVNSNLVRWYAGDILHFTHTDGVTIENIKVNCSSSTYAGKTTTPAFSSNTNNINTYILTETQQALSDFTIKTSAQKRFSYIEVTYSKKTLLPDAPITFGSGIDNSTQTIDIVKDVANDYWTAAPVLSGADGLPVTYASSDDNVAMMDDDKVMIVSAGTTTISATSAATEQYAETTVSYTLVVEKATPVIKFTQEKVTLNAGEEYTPAFTDDTTPGLTYAYSIANEDLALIDENTGHILADENSGTTTVTATSAETATYKSGSASFTLEVKGKLAPTLAFNREITDGKVIINLVDDVNNGEWTNPVLATCAENLSVKYRSSNEEVVMAEDGMFMIVGPGTTTITAYTESTPEYASASISYELVVEKKAMTLTLDPATENYDLMLGDEAPVAVFVNGASSEAVTVSSSDEAVAVYADGKITTKGAGTAELTFTLAETATATGAVAKVTVNVTDPNAPKVDVLTTTVFNKNSYTTAVTYNSDETKASYTGYVMNNKDNMQMNAGSSNGIYTIKSGGVVKNVTFKWASNTTAEREFVIYGSHTAYTGKPTSKELARFKYASGDTEKTFDFTSLDEQYEYVGFNSGGKVIYVEYIKVEWGAGLPVATLTFPEGVAASEQTVNIVDDVNAEGYWEAAPKATCAEGLDIIYTSSNPEIAAFDETGLKILAAGTTTVTAEVKSTSEYAGAKISYTLNVVKAVPVLKFTAESASVKEGESIAMPAVECTEGLTLTYSTDNTLLSIAEDGSSIIAAAVEADTDVVLKAAFAGDARYKAAEATIPVKIIAKLHATLSFGEAVDGQEQSVALVDFDGKAWTEAPVATCSAELPVIYSTADATVAEYVDGALVIRALGTTTVTASVEATEEYAAVSTSYTLNVVRKPTVITFNPDKSIYSYPNTVQVGDSFEVLLNGETADGSREVKVAGSDDNVATWEGGTIQFGGALGTTVLTFSVDENKHYEAASAEVKVIVYDPEVPEDTNTEFEFKFNGATTKGEKKYGMTYSDTYNLSEDWSDTETNITYLAKTSDSNAFRLWTDGIRVYGGKTVTINIGAPVHFVIKKVEAFGAASSHVSVSEGNGEYKNGVWSGSHKNVELIVNNTTSKYLLMSGLTVTYCRQPEIPLHSFDEATNTLHFEVPENGDGAHVLHVMVKDGYYDFSMDEEAQNSPRRVASTADFGADWTDLGTDKLDITPERDKTILVRTVHSESRTPSAGTISYYTDSEGTTTGVGNVAVDSNADAEYYTLQGVRVAADNLTPGFYICRQGKTVSKILVK